MTFQPLVTLIPNSKNLPDALLTVNQEHLTLYNSWDTPYAVQSESRRFSGTHQNVYPDAMVDYNRLIRHESLVLKSIKIPKAVDPSQEVSSWQLGLALWSHSLLAYKSTTIPKLPRQRPDGHSAQMPFHSSPVRHQGPVQSLKILWRSKIVKNKHHRNKFRGSKTEICEPGTQKRVNTLAKRPGRASRAAPRSQESNLQTSFPVSLIGLRYSSYLTDARSVCLSVCLSNIYMNFFKDINQITHSIQMLKNNFEMVIVFNWSFQNSW